MSGFVYAIGAPGAETVKIGFARNPQQRLGALRCGSREDLRIIGTVLGDPSLEDALHERFSFAKIRGEWFRLVGEVADFVAGLQPHPARSRVRSGRAALKTKAARSSTWQGMIDTLLALEAIVGAAAASSRSRMSRLAVNDSTFLDRVIAGANFRLETYDRVVNWFSDNWPSDAKWPAGVQRPEPAPAFAPEPAQ